MVRRLRQTGKFGAKVRVSMFIYYAVRIQTGNWAIRWMSWDV